MTPRTIVEYKSTLMELEQILKDSGLEEGDLKVAASAGGVVASGQVSRNRR